MDNRISSIVELEGSSLPWEAPMMQCSVMAQNSSAAMTSPPHVGGVSRRSAAGTSLQAWGGEVSRQQSDDHWWTARDEAILNIGSHDYFTAIFFASLNALMFKIESE